DDADGLRRVHTLKCPALIVAAPPIPDADVAAVRGGETEDFDGATAILGAQTHLAEADVLDAEDLLVFAQPTPLVNVRAVCGGGGFDIQDAVAARAVRPDLVVSVALMIEVKLLV